LLTNWIAKTASGRYSITGTVQSRLAQLKDQLRRREGKALANRKDEAGPSTGYLAALPHGLRSNAKRPGAR
jgi:hypothetical protein